MATKAQRMRIFANAYSDYYAIENMNDLQNNRLTLAEYHVLSDVLKELSTITDGKIVYTFMDRVAMWLLNHGFTVIEHGINYAISI